MNAKDFNNDLTKLVLRTVRDGVHTGQTTLPQLVGVLRAHADELMRQHERMQKVVNGTAKKNAS